MIIYYKCRVDHLVIEAGVDPKIELDGSLWIKIYCTEKGCTKPIKSVGVFTDDGVVVKQGPLLWPTVH